MSRPRMVRSAVCVLLALITLLVYLPVRHDSFVYDDLEYVTQNPVVQAGLTWWGFKWAFTTMTTANWYPLTWLSHMLDCQLFGLNAGGHHLVNVLFHAANAVLLFGLLRRLTGTCWPSALIAALFAWHPLHVESVAWVAERKDVLSTFFGLLTLWAYTRYAREQAARSPQPETLPERHAFSLRLLPSSRFYFPALFFFALGLMSKPMLVTVPFVLLLLDYWPLQRVPNYELRFSRWSRLVLEKWPFFLLAAASCVVTFVAQKHGEAVAPLEEYPLSARLGNAAVACLEYLFKSVYPVNLAVFYPLPEGMVWGQVAGAVMVLAVITGLVWRARRQCPYLFTGWFWYLGMLVPVIGVVQVGLQAMADRYMYLPSIGVFMGAVFGLRELAKKLRLAPGVIILVGGIVLAGCLWGTTRQLRCWRNSETLFRHALAVTENNYPAHNNLGAALDAEGQSAEAIRQFQAALRLAPDYADAHNNLGIALNQEGQSAEAIRQFQEAVRLKPDYASAHNSLGAALAKEGQSAEAIRQFQEAVRLKPDYALAHYNLGLALGKEGQGAEAIRQFQAALRLEPDYADAHNNLGIALANAGRIAEAIRQFQETIRLKPDYATAHGNLGQALALTGHPREAIEQFHEALQLNLDIADSARVHSNLGHALLQTGQLQPAIDQFREALQLDPDSARVQSDLGNALLQQGQVEQAMTHYRAALKLEPNDVKSLNNLAWLLATCPEARLRNGQEAVRLAERACQLTDYKVPPLLGTLAAACAEEGRFADAAAAAQKAHDLALALGQPSLALKDQQLLQLFKNHQPYREPSAQNQ